MNLNQEEWCNMNSKLAFALIATAALLIVAPVAANAQCGIGGCGMGAGCGVAYGAPQDCVAQVSCNIPATQMVPYMTSTTAMQPVSYPVAVPQTSFVTVPKAVVVPEQVPVETCSIGCAQTAVPVQVPQVAYQPVTSYIPQCYTMPVGGAACPPAGPGMGGYEAQPGMYGQAGFAGSQPQMAQPPMGQQQMMAQPPMDVNVQRLMNVQRIIADKN